ncbi:rhomboid family intramembrane serine protease [Rhodohalobacter mucosus]|uniref:Rhomboid family intramembrane serine protease n=1 Tax=Rhodohalobacter mucosus TaxID=2079485 RepID=A0A316TS40_9BACT|nr:rhomboid family intramembrane serine protease [Rhodohalobacter mucosus]PWN06678.1 rhomboid family intramembrane serine protease [Rhodohalobacter mucosus]
MYQNDSFGGAIKRGFLGMPVIIRTIIAVNVVVFAFQALLGGIQIGGTSLNNLIVTYLGFNPNLFTAITQPWRFFTYMFLHGSGFHLLFNMLWLWWMGRAVEEGLGPRTFSVLYFGAGIGGAFFHIALSFLYGTSIVIGASGAVFGIMVAFAYMYPRVPIMLLFLPPIEARFVVAALIALDVLFLGAGDNVARLVHLGGAGIGYLLVRSHYRGTDLSKFVRPIERIWNPQMSSGKGKKRKARNSKMYSVSDVEIVEESNESELDAILEKISREGYDGLTAEEKKKLFELSKKN